MKMSANLEDTRSDCGLGNLPKSKGRRHVTPPSQDWVQFVTGTPTGFGRELAEILADRGPHRRRRAGRAEDRPCHPGQGQSRSRGQPRCEGCLPIPGRDRPSREDLRGIGVIPWSPLARSCLAGNRRRSGPATTQSQTDSFGHRMFGHGYDFAVAEAVERIAARRGVTSAQVALAWLLSRPGVMAPTIGATKPIILMTLSERSQSTSPTTTSRSSRRLTRPTVTSRSPVGLARFRARERGPCSLAGQQRHLRHGTAIQVSLH